MKFPSEKTAIMLIGLPGSGKSTWAENFIKNNPSADFHVISMDKHMDKHAAPYREQKIDAWKLVSNMAFKDMIAELEGAVSEGKNIIFDRCNSNEDVRGVLLKRLDESWSKVAIDFVTSEATCKSRVQKRAEETGRVLDESFINDIAKRLTHPKRHEFDLVVRVDELGKNIKSASTSSKGQILKELFPVNEQGKINSAEKI